LFFQQAHDAQRVFTLTKAAANLLAVVVADELAYFIKLAGLGHFVSPSFVELM
jgi:hypothetical protein